MKELTIKQKNLLCDISISISKIPYRGFKQDMTVACQVLYKFLKSQKGRGLIQTSGPKSDKTLCVSLLICGKHKIRRLNNEHRSKDKPTDVLSFPQFTDWSEALEFHTTHLGDIVICYDVWLKQAKNHQTSIRHEFFHLFFHGFLHLLDYDHERSQKEAKLMFELEDQLVQLAMSNN